jgi:hypothetical protein
MRSKAQHDKPSLRPLPKTGVPHRDKPTMRQKLRAKTFPLQEGAERLAGLLGVHYTSVYRFERRGNESLPRNGVLRKCYEALIAGKSVDLAQMDGKMAVLKANR